MTSRRGRIRIGTSGYQYRHWRDVFYPEDVPQRAWLAYYTGVFETVELNATFYRLPDDAVVESWLEQVPSGFLFALKFSRYGSHNKRLKEPEKSVEPFVRMARILGDRLGPILVQLPPRWHINLPRLEAFLTALPSDLRWAVEFRDPGWLCEDTYRLLESKGVALCVHDMLPDHPERLTADWQYRRFHGVRYGGSYSRRQLEEQAARMNRLAGQGVDTYVYFNNDQGGWAPRNALELRGILSGRGVSEAGREGERPN